MATRRLALAITLIIITTLLTPLAAAPTTHLTTVANDSDVATSSPATSGGQKLIEDNYGKHLADYIVRDGRIGIAFTNSDPALQSSWTTPWKSPSPSTPTNDPPPSSLRRAACT